MADTTINFKLQDLVSNPLAEIANGFEKVNQKFQKTQNNINSWQKNFMGVLIQFRI